MAPHTLPPDPSLESKPSSMGAPDKMSMTVLGDAVNVAARLTSMAENGQVLAGDPTYAIVKDAVEVENIGPQSLRGRSRTLKAYLIKSLK